jgi:hypothetical protein
LDGGYGATFGRGLSIGDETAAMTAVEEAYNDGKLKYINPDNYDLKLSAGYTLEDIVAAYEEV